MTAEQPSPFAVDPLDALADLCAEEDLWLHIDGALGAVGVLDPAVADRYAGVERAHSLTVDPHKWLSVPVECGAAVVRDGALLRETFSLVPPYLRTEEGKGFGALIDAAEVLELLAPIDLSIVCFRYLPSGAHPAPEQSDALNKAIMEEVQAGGDASLTQTALDGRFSLRACIYHYATTEPDLLALLDAVRRAGRKLA